MADVKEYGFYLEGSQLAIVERDVAFDNDPNAKDYGPGTDKYAWKSPMSSVADGIELRYTYAPTYRIQTTNDVDTNITQYQSRDGKLTIADNSSAYINYATTYALAADKYVVLEKAGRFNGLHKIESLQNNTGTNNQIVFTTKYTGSESTWTNFEETPNLYYNVSALTDESFELDLPNYLQKALVYYVKAKVAEDVLDMTAKQIYEKEFLKQVEKHNNKRASGVRILSSGPNAIR